MTAYGQEAHVYDIDNNTWIQMDDMTHGRYGHRCHKVESATRGPEVIVVGVLVLTLMLLV